MTTPQTASGRTSNSFNKLRSRIERETGKAIGDYKMIEDGDVIIRRRDMLASEFEHLTAWKFAILEVVCFMFYFEIKWG